MIHPKMTLHRVGMASGCGATARDVAHVTIPLGRAWKSARGSLLLVMAAWRYARGNNRRTARAFAAALSLASVAAGWHDAARAEETADEKAAHEAYERGARAFGQGSYAVAATEFTRADELRPAPAALEAALKAAILAEDAVLAITLADRAQTRAPSEAIAAQTARARDRFAHKVGRLVLRCADPCSAKVGNESVPIGAGRYYLAGNYVIEITAGGSAELFAVQLPGGADMEWKPPSKTPPPALSQSSAATMLPTASVAPRSTATQGPLSPPPSRLSPIWFGLLTGVTAVSAGLTIGFGVDTLSQHDAFTKAPTAAGAASGQDAQLRTNLLLGVTTASLVGAAIVGYLAFRAAPSARSSARPQKVWISPPAPAAFATWPAAFSGNQQPFGMPY